MSAVRYFESQIPKNKLCLEKRAMSNRETYQQKIAALRLPKIDLAKIAGLTAPKISEYLRGDKLPYGESERIENGINAVERVQATLAPHRLDTSNAASFWDAYKMMEQDGFFQLREELNEQQRAIAEASREAVRL
jgi:predicted transcriptional regulator